MTCQIARPLGDGGLFAGIDPIFGEKRLMSHVNPTEAHFALAAMPEPSTCALAALGFVGLLAFGWRRRKR